MPARSRLLALFLLAAAAPRDDAARKLLQARQAQAAQAATRTQAARKAAAAQQAADLLAARLVQEALALRGVETGVIDADRRLREAGTQAAAADAGLRKREAELGALLPVVIRLARYPAETVLSVPGPPDRALLGLLLMRGLSAQIEQEAAALQSDQAEAARLHQQVAAHAASLAAQRQTQLQAASALDQRIDAARQTAAQARDDAAIAAQAEAGFAARAQTLQGMIAAMDQASRRRHVPAPPAGPGLAQAGTLAAPVAGKVLRAWGAPAEDGPATGITYAAAPGAFVTSPCAGRVAFAAPFRSYGKLMILDCGRGFDFVLAGMDRMDAAVGRSVRAGEPVGRMANDDPAKGGPALYLELRQNGSAVNPAPFLQTRQKLGGKGSPQTPPSVHVQPDVQHLGAVR